MEKQEKGLKLFGVRIEAPLFQEEEEAEEVMRKSFSTGNLASCVVNQNVDQGLGDHGYLSDGDIVKNSRKRGVPWTEEEHRTFLAGLQKLGKGDWRGVSRNFVITRTPTQVASHAQKYFLRQTNPNKKKRRSSLFDVGINDNVIPVFTETPSESLSLKKVEEVVERTDHQSRQNNLVHVQSLAATSATAQVAETSRAYTLVTNTVCVPNLLGVTPLGGSSKLHSESTNLVVNSDILQLAQHDIPTHGQPIVFSTLENIDLELSIAPPRPHPLEKLPSQIAAGAIRVM